VAFATDEHFRPNCSLDDMAKLKPAFLKENGTVTAGNASGLNDAAAAVVLMEAATAKARGLPAAGPPGGLRPRRRGPQVHGHRPGAGHQKALKKAGLTVNDLDVIEANEAFAAQACAVTRDLGLDPAKVNPNGSGISLGHPIGATGALITVKALHELQRASRAATRWSRCASAAARASPRSSSACEGWVPARMAVWHQAPMK
jgi:acetyl-CoA C-acetyltransferase